MSEITRCASAQYQTPMYQLLSHDLLFSFVIKSIVITLLTEGQTKIETQILTPRPVSAFDDVVVSGHPRPFPSEHPHSYFVGVLARCSSECKNTQHCWGLWGILRDGAGLAPGFTQPQPPSTLP